jgi:hypothetical protein
VTQRTLIDQLDPGCTQTEDSRTHQKVKHKTNVRKTIYTPLLLRVLVSQCLNPLPRLTGRRLPQTDVRERENLT